MTEYIFIYGLFDPRTLELRYIGISKHPTQRLKEHIWEAKRNLGKNTHKDNWIRKLLSENAEPSVEILEECTGDNWQDAERAWIADCEKFGLRLVNILQGGAKPPSFHEMLNPEEVRAKWSKTRKGRPSANRGREWSQEYKDKMSIALSGSNNPMYGKSGKDHPATDRIVSDETRRRLSEVRRRAGSSGKKRERGEAGEKKKSLTGKMRRAYRNGLIERVLYLQMEYFNLFGIYSSSYPHP